MFAEGAAASRRALDGRHRARPRLTLLPARSPATTVLVRTAACSARSRAGRWSRRVRSLESPNAFAGGAAALLRARRLALCSSVSPLQALALLAVRAHAAGPLDGRSIASEKCVELGG